MKTIKLNNGDTVAFSSSNSPEADEIFTHLAQFLNGDMSEKEFAKLHVDEGLNQAMMHLANSPDEDDEEGD
jgi:hypothetical protein